MSNDTAKIDAPPAPGEDDVRSPAKEPSVVEQTAEGQTDGAQAAGAAVSETSVAAAQAGAAPATAAAVAAAPQGVPQGAPNIAPGRGIGFLGRRGTAPIRTEGQGGDTPPLAAEGEEGSAAAADAPAPAEAAGRPTAPPPKPGMSENAFRFMSLLAPVFLLLLLVMQTAAGVYFPSLYLPAEVGALDVYGKMGAAGQWLATPAGLPGFYWFMKGVDSIPGLPPAFYLPVVACLAASVALLGTYTLGLCAGLGNRAAFAAGLILLSCLGFVPLTHWVGPELLLAGLVAFALACLCRGWLSEGALLWLCMGGLLTGLAFLVGGIPAVWIPVVSSIVLLFWRGTLRRGHRMDAVAGFVLLLLCVIGWLGAVILLAGDKAQALAPLSAQLFAPFLPPLWPPRDVWWQALALLPLALAPWVLLPLFVAWGSVLRNAWKSLKASRRENAGTAWLWIALVAGLLLLTAASHKPLLAATVLLPLGALLLAKALLRLSCARSRAFFLLLAVLCVLAGAALALAGIPAVAKTLEPHLFAPLPRMLAAVGKGLPVMGAVCLLSGLCLLKLTNRNFPGGSLAVVVLLATILVQPASLMVSPALVNVAGVQHARGMGIGLLPGAAAPAAQKPAPAAAPAAPEENKAAPAEEKTAPAEGAPAVMPAPGEEAAAPVAPVAKDTATPAPEAQKTAPAAAPTAPVEGKAVPGADKTPPVAAPASGESKAPADAAPTPPAEKAAPAAAPTAPKENKAAPAEGKTAPAEGAPAVMPAPGKDAAAPVVPVAPAAPVTKDTATPAPEAQKTAPAAAPTAPTEGKAVPQPAPAP